MAAGRLLVILVLLMAAAAGAAACGIPMPVPAFGVRDVSEGYCAFFRDIHKSAPFDLGTAAAIHLGNTNSCIAGYDLDPGTGTGTGTAGNYYQLCIPSWVAVTENGTLAGEAAMNHAAVSPGTAISGFMRFMNRRLGHPEVTTAMELELVPYKFVEWMGMAAIQVETADQQVKVFAVTHLAAILIAELKHKAEAHLGHGISNAVIAVPRHLTYAGRQDLEHAAGMWSGGVKAIDHQIAAAAAYGHHTEQGDGKTILVFRVGGRTSDATIFKFIRGVARYIYSQDDYFLGGDDLTARIVDYMAELIKQRHQWDIWQDGKALGSLRVACEHAKKALSEQEETLVQVEVDGVGAGVSFSAPLTRAKFEELNQDLLDRAMALLDGAVTRKPRGGGSKDMVDEIVLVGGSTRIPRLRQLVQDYMGGREPNSRKGVEAEEAIIHGTASLSRPEAARYVDECFEK